MTNFDIRQLAVGLNQFWDEYGPLVIVGVGLTALVLVILSLVLFFKAKNKAKWISTLAAVVVMAWTSEGLIHVARATWQLPGPFVGIAFFVFEALMLSAGMEAEEHRKRKGTPGPAGRYVFLIAASSGIAASFGSDQFGLQLLRIGLPVLAVGRWWIALNAERDDDTDEIRSERRRIREEREATWAITPRSVLIRAGVMRPGRTTTTEAQRQHQVQRMVVLADSADTTASTRARARYLRKLRRLARTADGDMVAEVAARVMRASRAAELMVPAMRPRVRVADDSGIGVSLHGARVAGDEAGRSAPLARAPEGHLQPGHAPVATAAPSGARAVDDSETGDSPLAPVRQDDARAADDPPSGGAPAEAGPRPAAPARPANGVIRSEVAGREPGEADVSTGAGTRGAGSRAVAAARADAAYLLYAAYVETHGAEPEGKVVATWMSYTSEGAGRKARKPWRLRMAGEIETGKRVRPTNLPGEIAALLRPGVRTRAPEGALGPAVGAPRPTTDNWPSGEATESLEPAASKAG